MRCGGCGAKVGATTLSNAMARIAPLVHKREEVIMGIDSPDDCAVVAVPSHLLPGSSSAAASSSAASSFDVPAPNPIHLVHTVDFFRSFYEDPFVFGAIAAHHALSDCHAMAVPPLSALAVVVLPYGLEHKVGGCNLRLTYVLCVCNLRLTYVLCVCNLRLTWSCCRTGSSARWGRTWYSSWPGRARLWRRVGAPWWGATLARGQR